MTVLDKMKAFFKRPKPEAKGAENKGRLSLLIKARLLKKRGAKVAQSRKAGPAEGSQGMRALRGQEGKLC